ncbi:MAG TPA: nucleotidyltransferase domain-containing protein [Candidatus Thiothrix moscowensis]|jgi:predicted nucleotidyltransferase|uniref:nucleotidyltransferase domain-containing protein n=1 Tax=unclassified Thiothrix TaxID=2636184 RepID=UPI0025E43C32|nr:MULTISPECIES: nucleotidyltransferase domain-containing protein [unclassified Thiothrix]HRJ53793.1 nucleotidyltransferase domain-containing protein [Candidatus Thiothrix moscowensis]HRJ93875.1 nucleotidyltransferase domain-containing protein [Candidatus Thiothrix moscowensis]
MENLFLASQVHSVVDVAGIDADTRNAAAMFLGRISQMFPVAAAFLFGSRARHTHRLDSDADIAVVLSGQRGKRVDATVEMAGVAFDVMLDTGVLVQALPLWESELEHPEMFSNPELLANIRREGIPLMGLAA